MADNNNLLLLHAKINHIIRGVLVYLMSSLRVAAGCPPHTTQPQPHLMLLLSDFYENWESYLGEQFRQMTQNLAEQFSQLTHNLAEQFWQIANYMV